MGEGCGCRCEEQKALKENHEPKRQWMRADEPYLDYGRAFRIWKSVRGGSASSDVSSDISPSPLYIPPHHC